MLGRLRLGLQELLGRDACQRNDPVDRKNQRNLKLPASLPPQESLGRKIMTAAPRPRETTDSIACRAVTKPMLKGWSRGEIARSDESLRAYVHLRN
jgi:hypothetical protein